MSDDEIWEMTVEIAQHYRLDPNTKTDRCTCGHKTGLGRMFSEHVAQILVTQGWRKSNA